jgi:hypothetical protein
LICMTQLADSFQLDGMVSSHRARTYASPEHKPDNS